MLNFYNIIMTGESTQTALEERMVPGLNRKSGQYNSFSATGCSARYTVLQMKNTTRRTSAINSATTEKLNDYHYKHT